MEKQSSTAPEPVKVIVGIIRTPYCIDCGKLIKAGYFCSLKCANAMETARNETFLRNTQ